MRRARIALALLMALALSALGWLLAPAPRGDKACRAVALRAAGTGADIQGTEDLALDAGRGRLIVSAYDRRTNAPGGLYAVALSTLETNGGAPVAAAPLVLDPPAPLRPHGIALAEGGDGAPRLYVINRLKTAEGRKAELLVLRLDGARATRLGRTPLPCGANDVLPLDGRVLVTVDRERCAGIRRWLADALNLVHGRLIAVAPDGAARTLARGIDFANGIAADESRIYVAATRARALLAYDRAALAQGAAPASPLFALKLPGAPDNIARGADGRLYIASHRSLYRFAAYLGGVRGDSPGDVFVYDPKAGAGGPRHLFRLTRILDGPTSAVAAGALLVAGGGYSAGLAVCAMPGGGAP